MYFIPKTNLLLINGLQISSKSFKREGSMTRATDLGDDQGDGSGIAERLALAHAATHGVTGGTLG